MKKGLKVASPPLKVKDHPRVDELKRWLHLGDDDDAPEVEIVWHPFPCDFTGDTLSISVHRYALAPDGTTTRLPAERNDDLVIGPEPQPAIPPDDVLDDDGNVIAAKGSWQGEVPTLRDVMAMPINGKQVRARAVGELIANTRAAIFDILVMLRPWMAGSSEVDFD